MKERFDIEALYEKMRASEKKEASAYAKEYGGDRNMRPSQVGMRADKWVSKEGGKRLVSVAKIPLSFQQKIVRTGVSFLFGEAVQRIPSEENEAFSLMDELWRENRLDHLLRVFCEKVQSETEAALVFFEKKNKEGFLEIKTRVLSSENGQLYPYFDAYGDMQAFGWEFETQNEGKTQSHLYVFTDHFLYVYIKGETQGGWVLDEKKSKPNLFKKIPVVYHAQEYPQWWEVKELIDRYEMTFSKFCDTNDYFASPMLMVKGAVDSLPQKDDTGKLLKLDIMETERGNVVGADVSYLTWDQAPEAIQLELDHARSLIYALTDTPDLSLDNLKGLGGVPSGFALQMLFMGAIVKAKWKEGEYTTVVSRAINILKAGLSFIHPNLSERFEKLKVRVKFSSILPQNLSEMVRTLSEANGGKPLMSQAEAVRKNPLVEDPSKTLEELEEEARQEQVESLSQSYKMR